MVDLRRQSTPNCIAFTRFTNHNGRRLTKELSLNADDTLRKENASEMSRGIFETLTVDASAPGIAGRLIESLSERTTAQALSSSLSIGDYSGKVVVKEALSQNPGAVARTAQHFGFKADVGGLVILDYDPPKGSKPLSPDELGVILSHVWPALADGVALHWSSTGSMVYHPDGNELVGMTGQRVFIAIKSNADVTRVVRVLNDRCTLLGYGRAKINKIGAVSFAPLFDPAMQESARLDYSPAGCVLRDGLTQRRGLPTILADGEVLDSAQTLPDLTSAEAAEVQAIIVAAKDKARPEAELVKAAYIAEREQSAAVHAVKSGADVEHAKRQARVGVEALMAGVLMGTTELIHVDDEGNELVVAVDQLLREPKDWHGKKFLSPGNPDHRGRSADAIAYLLQAAPVLYDLDGPVSYRLERKAVRLVVATGNRASLAEQLANQLANRSDLFNMGGRVVQFVEGSPHPVTLARVMFLIGTTCALYRQNKDGKSSPADVEQQTAQMALALLPERCRKILGRSAIPIIDKDGRIAQAPGLDDDTGYFLDVGPEFLPVQFNPTRDQLIAALRRLWFSWSRYEWTTPHDRAAMLASILTIPLRPTIQAAPGLFLDSASQGSGKSSAARAILCIVQGHGQGLTPWKGDDEREIGKRLLALAISGSPVACYDNLVGRLESSAIAGAMIEGFYTDRELGQSANAGGVFRPMWIMSGNQASLGPDCGTRFLQARIACPDGEPHKKSFPFEPSQAALADRPGIVQAILTVHRGWHAAGRPQVDDTTTRYVDWGRVIRQMVLWLQSEGLAESSGIGELGDPGESILNRATDSDPDSEANADLFAQLAESFEIAEPFDAPAVWRAVQAGQGNQGSQFAGLADAILGILKSSRVSRQSITPLLMNRRDRRYGGLHLKALPKGTDRSGQRASQQFVLVSV